MSSNATETKPSEPGARLPSGLPTKTWPSSAQPGAARADRGRRAARGRSPALERQVDAVAGDPLRVAISVGLQVDVQSVPEGEPYEVWPPANCNDGIVSA
jgi:hypothetical protein